MVRTGFTELSAGDSEKKRGWGGGAHLCEAHRRLAELLHITNKKKARNETHLYASKKKRQNKKKKKGQHVPRIGGCAFQTQSFLGSFLRTRGPLASPGCS